MQQNVEEQNNSNQNKIFILLFSSRYRVSPVSTSDFLLWTFVVIYLCDLYLCRHSCTSHFNSQRCHNYKTFDFNTARGHFFSIPCMLILHEICPQGVPCMWIYIQYNGTCFEKVRNCTELQSGHTDDRYIFLLWSNRRVARK